MSTKYVVVYNTTPDPIPVDDEGRVVATREWAAVQRSKVQTQIADGNLLVVDVNTIDDNSNPIAFQAKQQYERLMAEWETEKTSASDSTQGASKTVYDEPETVRTVTKTGGRRGDTSLPKKTSAS